MKRIHIRWGIRSSVIVGLLTVCGTAALAQSITAAIATSLNLYLTAGVILGNVIFWAGMYRAMVTGIGATVAANTKTLNDPTNGLIVRMKSVEMTSITQTRCDVQHDHLLAQQRDFNMGVIAQQQAFFERMMTQTLDKFIAAERERAQILVDHLDRFGREVKP